MSYLVKIIIFFKFLFFFGVTLVGQSQDIEGIYQWGRTSHLTIQPNGEAFLSDSGIDYGKIHRGYWYASNDTTINIQLIDTAYISMTNDYVSRFNCMCDLSFEKIVCNFEKVTDNLSKTYFDLFFYKTAEFHSNNSIKWAIKKYRDSFIITVYYENGKIQEILPYENGRLNGWYYKYHVDGNLIIIENWKKGKMKSSKIYNDYIGLYLSESLLKDRFYKSSYPISMSFFTSLNQPLKVKKK